MRRRGSLRRLELWGILLNGGEENHAVVSGVENGGRRKSIEYTSFGHCKEACIDDDHDDYHETELVYLMYLSLQCDSQDHTNLPRMREMPRIGGSPISASIVILLSLASSVRLTRCISFNGSQNIRWLPRHDDYSLFVRGLYR
jgi:hypothetical protein